VLVNPVRNSNRALTPAGIILKCYSPGEEQDIISNGVNGDGEYSEEDMVFFSFFGARNPIDYHGISLCPETTQNPHDPLHQQY